MYVLFPKVKKLHVKCKQTQLCFILSHDEYNNIVYFGLMFVIVMAYVRRY